MARVIAAALQQRLARPVTIENRPGAAGAAVGEILKKAPDRWIGAGIHTDRDAGRAADDQVLPVRSADRPHAADTGRHLSTGLAVSRKIDVSTWPTMASGLTGAGPEGARFGTTSLQSFTTSSASWSAASSASRSKPSITRRVAADRRPRAGKDSRRHQRPHVAAAASSRSRLRILVSSGNQRSKIAPDIPHGRRARLSGPGIAELVRLLRTGRPVARGGRRPGTRTAQHARYTQHDRPPDPARPRVETSTGEQWPNDWQNDMVRGRRSLTRSASRRPMRPETNSRDNTGARMSEPLKVFWQPG